MELTLVYRNILRANGSRAHKQDIRRLFHEQLREFWKQTPFPDLKNPAETLTKQVGRFRFFPLVVEGRREVAELHITMLRPEPPGYIITHGGDIDNRLKTLFDSLRMPNRDEEIPAEEIPLEGEDPFFCLLEDDKLITKVSVVTDQLLEPCETGFVHLLIHINIRQIPAIGANMVIVAR
jgi:hypothetical protein